MDYEKAYKNALERARQFSEHPLQEDSANIVEYIFPELKESEDEKIRKEITEFLKKASGGFLDTTTQCKTFGKWLTWLEKQDKKRKITHDEICQSYSIPNIGEFSDGYHTFNGLYKQRMILFAVLVKTYKDKAWKSWKHEDGLDCFGGGWFIVGIDTPEGTYTYHYEAKDWDKFDCKILEKAKHWDGHDESDVERLFSLISGEQKPKWGNDDEQYLLICKNALRKYQVSDKWDADIISKWLEDKLKQGEPKPDDKVKPKFKVGDTITYIGERKELVVDNKYTIKEISKDCYISTRDNKIPFSMQEYYTTVNDPKFKVGDWVANEVHDICLITDIDLENSYYFCESNRFGNTDGDIDLTDKAFHLWTIQDAKDGDVLCCENGWTCIFNCLHDNLFDSHCFMDAEGWFCEDGGQAHTLDNRICGEIHPATKEQRDLLFSKMKEAGYEWDEEKKELKIKLKEPDVYEYELERIVDKLNEVIGKLGDIHQVLSKPFQFPYRDYTPPQMPTTNPIPGMDVWYKTHGVEKVTPVTCETTNKVKAE